jgi:KaiC/GvpD/RAD55 family RecA-like ATPase
MNTSRAASLPYSDIFIPLLSGIHKALAHCHKMYSQGKIVKENDRDLEDIFRWLEKKYETSGLNKHLTKGLSKTVQKRGSIYPRLSKLIIYHYEQTQDLRKKSNYKAEIIPSPLHILYLSLTVPEEPQTAAYAFVLCRSMLFYFLNIHPAHPLLNEDLKNLDPLKEEEILKSISSFVSHINQQARWPDKRYNYKSFTTRVHYLNGHILSLKGVTHLWFNSADQLLDFCEIPDSEINISKIKELYSNANEHSKKYYFRLSGKYTGLPDTSEIINWIFGIPIPIRGADILFYGGLKRSSKFGLVVSIHGQPGVGKTSTALSLAAILSPFETKTIYISLEEDPEDLKTRLYTLIPDYLRWLSIYENNYYNLRKRKDDSNAGWFTAFRIDENINIEQLTGILEILKKDLDGQETGPNDINKSSQFRIPAICPLLIVIDNVNELFPEGKLDSERYTDLERFINQCRKMGAIVLLIAADDVTGRNKIDFLVDVAIHLKQEGLNSRNEKPIRTLELIKTRYQLSRQGSHVYHLSNAEGLRISPQVPSQLDKREKIRIELPSESEFIHTLDLVSKDQQYEEIKYLRMAKNSQILVHGYGSSGKAGLGLKILLTPDLEYQRINKNSWQLLRNKEGRITCNNNLKKVLIISFLYPSDYYDGLHIRLKDQFKHNFSNFERDRSKIDVKAFYPGYLTQEDFFYKIVRLLDEARLEGEPYTGVLLDGLHNIFLQFKSLQDAHMVWPLLYSLLTRYQLTAVSTFTNFSLNDRHTNQKEKDLPDMFQIPGDFMLMQEGQKPFLHGLVKAADYYFLLEEVIDDENDYKKDYWIITKNSIRQVPPKDGLRWDREKLIITGLVPAPKIYGVTKQNGT